MTFPIIENPPPPAGEVSPRGTKYFESLEQLQDKPLTWGVIGIFETLQQAKNACYSLSSRRYSVPEGSFEFCYRKRGDEFAVYARALERSS